MVNRLFDHISNRPDRRRCRLLNAFGIMCLSAAGLAYSAMLQAAMPELSVVGTNPASAEMSTTPKEWLRDARLADSLRRYADAEVLYRKALVQQTKAVGEMDSSVTDILLDLAVNVSNQGRYQESAALFRRVAPAVERSAFEADRARFSQYQGYDAANRGDFASALTFARNASSIWERLAKGNSVQSALNATDSNQEDLTVESGEWAMALNFQAKMALRNDDVVSANAAASQALLLLDKTEGLPIWWRPSVLLTLGEISAVQGRMSAAQTYYNSALAQRLQIYGPGLATIQVLAELGRAYDMERMPTSAIITFRQAFEQAKALPSTTRIFTREQLLAFGHSIVEYAATVSDPMARQGLYAEAFDAFQYLRGSVVDQTIVRAQSRLAANNPSITRLVERLQGAERHREQAQVELSMEQAQSSDLRNNEAEQRLIQAMLSDEQTITQARSELGVQFPEYASLVNPPPMSLAELRYRLGDREGVLSFILGAKYSFVQLVRRDGSYIAKVPAGEGALDDSIRALRRALDIQGGAVNEFDLNAAHRLYDDLLGPVAVHLKGLDHLIISPTGPLASLPFALLVTRPPADGNYSKAAWLGQQYAISHTPSVQAFFELRKARVLKMAPYSLLAFADPVLVGETSQKDKPSALSRLTDACRNDDPINPDTLRALQPLPDTASEVNTVARLVGKNTSSVFVRQQATEEALRSQNLGDYRMLYFATHGLLPGELRCQSEPGLVLSPPGKTALNKATDGLLEASEIATFKLNADLVVLSACNTAAGSGKMGGEALSGLAEAFFYAGARSLVVSQWQVPSAATEQLMSGMFGAMGSDLGGVVATALQKSQAQLIANKKTAHPFFWAAFEVVGDGMLRSNPTVSVAEPRRQP